MGELGCGCQRGAYCGVFDWSKAGSWDRLDRGEAGWMRCPEARLGSRG